LDATCISLHRRLRRRYVPLLIQREIDHDCVAGHEGEATDGSTPPPNWLAWLVANYAPASAYLTYATHPTDRTTVMIANSAASILGFILGPGDPPPLLSPPGGFSLLALESHTTDVLGLRVPVLSSL